MMPNYFAYGQSMHWLESRWASHTPESIRIAFHEAGHAVAALAMGFTIREVTIEPGEDYAGQMVRNRDTRGISPGAVTAWITLAGRAAEEVQFGGSHDEWLTETLYTDDLSDVRQTMPGITDAEIIEMKNEVRQMLREWPLTFDRITDDLLRKHTLDWDGVLACIPDEERHLRTHWQQFAGDPAPAPAPVYAPASQPAAGRAEMIRTLEEIERAIRAGASLPARVKHLLDTLDDGRSRYGGARLEYGQPLMIETRGGYENRMLGGAR